MPYGIKSFPISNCRLPIFKTVDIDRFRSSTEICDIVAFTIGNRQLEIRNICWRTWHDLNVQPRPSHSRALIPLSYRSWFRRQEQ